MLPDTGLPELDKPEARKRGRKPLPADLPRERIEYDLPEDQKTCQCCGKALHRMGEDVSEQLLFEYQLGRGGEHPRAFLGDYPGNADVCHFEKIVVVQRHGCGREGERDGLQHDAYVSRLQRRASRLAPAAAPSQVTISFPAGYAGRPPSRRQPAQANIATRNSRVSKTETALALADLRLGGQAALTSIKMLDILPSSADNNPPTPRCNPRTS